MRSCLCEAPSLTRGWVCNLQCNHSRVRVAQNRNHTLLSYLRLPQPGGPGSRIYIPREQGGPIISQGTGFALLCLLQLAGLRWRYSNPQPGGPGPHIYMYIPLGTGWSSPKSKSKSCYDRRSVNQYVLVPRSRVLRGAPSE
jgi:hypothetical protein